MCMKGSCKCVLAKVDFILDRGVKYSYMYNNMFSIWFLMGNWYKVRVWKYAQILLND